MSWRPCGIDATDCQVGLAAEKSITCAVGVASEPAPVPPTIITFDDPLGPPGSSTPDFWPARVCGLASIVRAQVDVLMTEASLRLTTASRVSGST